MGSIGILNVGAGDTKLVFDSSNPIECIRAARIVTDMLRRGYALLVKLADGSYQRVHAFDEKTHEYIIADRPEDTTVAPPPENTHEQEPLPAPQGTKPEKNRGRRIKATHADGIAVGRTAGG